MVLVTHPSSTIDQAGLTFVIKGILKIQLVKAVYNNTDR